MSDTAASKGRLRRIGNSITEYFRQTRAELRKVTWPTRRETLRLTGIVLAVTAVMAAFLGLVDYLLTLLFALFI